MPKRLQQIMEIETLRSQKSQYAVDKVMQEEARLRAQLQDLKESKRIQDLPIHVRQAVNSSGVDARWLAWVNHVETATKTELAQVLARKEYIKIQACKDLGRKMASEATLEAALSKKQKDLNKRRISRIQDLTMILRMFDSNQ